MSNSIYMYICILTYTDLDYCLNLTTYCSCLLYRCVTATDTGSDDIKSPYSEINGKICLI